MTNNKFLNVRIMNIAEQIYSSNDATMVLMPGADGEIGVMHGRTPLVIELKTGKISIYNGEKIISTIEVSGGIARVNNDSVDVILS